MCSILWCILYTWEALGCMFSNLSLDSWIGNKGEKERWKEVALHPRNLSQESRGSLSISFAFLAFGGCGLLYQIGLTDFGNWSDQFWWNRSDRFWKPAWLVCAQSWHLFRGVCICAGGALVCLGGLCSLLEHSFVSDVSSHCPCLRGPRLVFFKWSCSSPFFGFRSLVGVSFYSFLFFFPFLWLSNVCVVDALIKGEIEDHVWFEDRWMVASWCDEWLTTLWTDSWLSITGAGCGLTLVGAGEKQAGKVVVGEASKCGEDK
jgi:hypothetical protein